MKTFITLLLLLFCVPCEAQTVEQEAEKLQQKLQELENSHAALVRTVAAFEQYKALLATATNTFGTQVAGAQAQLKALAAVIAAQAPGGPGTGPDPDPGSGPGTGDPGPAPGASAPPDFSGAPFASLLPPFPAYKIPTIDDCEWIVRDRQAVSTKGLATITADADDGGLLGHAYRASIAAGHALPITFGVWDDAGPAVVGGQWYDLNGRSITSKKPDGTYAALQVEVVGLDDQCEVQIGWGGPWGATDYLGVFNIGLRGQNNIFLITANNPQNKIVLDGCWFLNAKIENFQANAGLHVANWHTLVIRRHKFRGEKPTDPGTLFREHTFYFKNTGPGGLWVVESDLRGGNGTCFQVRPGKPDEAFPVSEPNGPIVVAHNRAHGYGFTHGSDPATSNGGSALSFWTSPNHPVFVYKNTITDARYGCLMFGGQPVSPFNGQDRNWYNSDGFPIKAAYIAANTFENARGDRPAVSVSAVQNVHIYGDNKILNNGIFVLNSEWNATRTPNGTKNGSIRLYGQMFGENFVTYDSVLNLTRKMTDAEVGALRVASPVPFN